MDWFKNRASSNKHRRAARAVLLLLALLAVSVRGEAKYARQFTAQNPLVVACDWELPPYEFLDDEGRPAGYSVELLSAILTKMGIPYRFEMKENPLTADSLHPAGDLFMVSTFLYNDNDCYVSSNIMYYYRVRMASRTDAPDVRFIEDIGADKLLVFRLDGRLTYSVFSKLRPKAHVEYHAPMEALAGVSSGKYDYFVWGEEPLKWKIKELNIDNLVLRDVSLPAIEVRIGSHDHALIEAIDDQYARLDQTGDIEQLREKWFHPERHHDNASPVVLYVAAAVLLMLVVLFLLNRLVSRNVKRKTLRTSEQSRLMNLALGMGGYMVSEYNNGSDRFKNLSGNMMDESMTLGDFMETIHKDDLRAFMEKLDELRAHDATISRLTVRRNAGTVAEPEWQYLTGNCIREHGDDNNVNYLLVAKDITREMDEQHENDDMAVKFAKAFDVSLVAMSFYDAEGNLLDMNEQMRRVVGANDENQQFFTETRLFDAPLFRDVLYPGMKEVMHACQHMYYPDIHLDKYLEYRIRPVVNEGGDVRYYSVTVRDITAERNLYREQLITQRQLQVTNEEVDRFETQMNYLLLNSNMFIWRSNQKEQIIEFGRSLHKTELAITFDDYIGSLNPEERNKARELFNNPLSWTRPVNYVRHFAVSPMTKREAWFAVSGTPTFDSRGRSTGHFGLVRDVTQLMRSQEELRRETAQAEQSGALKAAFLANMTHEIRTPLNAIVGFSDLLHMAGTSEERKEFVHIIRHNCDLLLRLINDILETSSMGHKPQSIEPVDIDFSTFFDEMCQTLAQRVQTPGVEFVKDNPYDTFPACTDKERIQQVVTNFVTNAVKYTKQGHVKVGYRAMDDGIYIYCEDTGAGIPKEKQDSVFVRFVKLNDYVQGTGLGLSICKAIADRCGGRIGVVSEGEGKGSTFWLWIPRYLTSSNLSSEK